MTMKELAKAANVSVSAVSKAFNQADDISEETRQHIFKVAKEYGCYGKFFKGKYPKPVIAIICHDLKSKYFSTHVERLQEIIEKDGGIPVVMSYNYETELQMELLEYFSTYLQVDGIIVFRLRNELKKAFETPIVSLFRSSDPQVDAVEVDLQTARFEMFKKLRELGHRRIAFAGDQQAISARQDFEQAMAKYGGEGELFLSDYRFEQAGADCAKQILQSDPPYTAVCCAYDNIAFSLMKHLKENGVRVPQDISVVGTDNILFSAFSETPLTTIDARIDETCFAAWEILQKKMDNRYYKPPKKVCLTGEVVLRDSVAPPPVSEMQK